MIMTMRKLFLIGADDLKDEKEQIMKRDPTLGIIISDIECYNFMKLLMEISEDHYHDEHLFSIRWLRGNLQNIHGGVGFFGKILYVDNHIFFSFCVAWSRTWSKSCMLSSTIVHSYLIETN